MLSSRVSHLQSSTVPHLPSRGCITPPREWVSLTSQRSSDIILLSLGLPKLTQQHLPDPHLQPYDHQLLLPFMSPFMETYLLEAFHLCVG